MAQCASLIAPHDPTLTQCHSHAEAFIAAGFSAIIRQYEPVESEKRMSNARISSDPTVIKMQRSEAAGFIQVP